MRIELDESDSESGMIEEMRRPTSAMRANCPALTNPPNHQCSAIPDGMNIGNEHGNESNELDIDMQPHQQQNNQLQHRSSAGRFPPGPNPRPRNLEDDEQLFIQRIPSRPSVGTVHSTPIPYYSSMYDESTHTLYI